MGEMDQKIKSSRSLEHDRVGVSRSEVLVSDVSLARSLKGSGKLAT